MDRFGGHDDGFLLQARLCTQLHRMGGHLSGQIFDSLAVQTPVRDQEVGALRRVRGHCMGGDYLPT